LTSIIVNGWLNSRSETAKPSITDAGNGGKSSTAKISIAKELPRGTSTTQR
jgi:hypothetical protein